MFKKLQYNTTTKIWIWRGKKAGGLKSGGNQINEINSTIGPMFGEMFEMFGASPLLCPVDLCQRYVAHCFWYS
jgi:hypothetical protein